MNKPKLLLLHGALGAATDFDTLVELLSEHYSCYRPNFPGHGQTEFLNEPMSMQGLATFLAEYTETNQLQHAMVFGYSMGGFVACLTQLQKGYFSKIYTLGTKFIWDPDSALKEASRLEPENLQNKVPAFAESLKNMHGVHWTQLLQQTAMMMLALGNKPAITTEAFGQLQIPLCIGLGDRDKMIPIEDAITVFRWLPSAYLDILPYSPHPLNAVDVALLSARLRYFFELRSN
ncbi:MAG: alpha/beta fold hydrolase [Bacteroidia bacterium]